MATKTVVCSQCGAEAAPGRFACADCGALLASVGPVPPRRRVAPRRSARRAPAAPAASAIDTSTAEVADRDGPGAEPPASGADPGASAADHGASAADPAPAALVEAVADEATVGPADGRADPVGPADGPGADPPSLAGAPLRDRVVAHEPAWSEPEAFDADDELIDEDAPLAAMATTGTAGPHASVRGPSASPGPLAAAVATPAAPNLPVTASLPLATLTTAPGAAAWPPAGAGAMMAVATRAAAEPRALAGAYLAPSAVLPPLDAHPSSRNGSQATDAATPAASTQGETPRPTSIAETLEAFGINGDVPRRLIGAGAAIAVLGFLLPWAEVVIGSGLSGSYWARWGMAGPGHWIIVGLLVGLLGLAFARERLARVPIGPIAIGVGTLLVGLVWPYLFGVIGRSVGVWLVLVGAIVLAVGGILDLRRHADADPPV